MPWKLSNDRPIYLQLADQIKLLILSGRYPAGSSFPTVRELATEASVNPNTMQRALALLEQDGLLIGSRTQGRTVTTDESLIRGMRGDLADQIYSGFYLSLTELGFTEQQIREFLHLKLS